MQTVPARRHLDPQRRPAKGAWPGLALLALLGACGGGGGAAGGTGGAAAQPTVTLSASSASVASGGTVTLTWSSTDANSCTASGAWSGSKATSGTETSTPLTAAATFTLVCTGTGGSGQRSVSVAIAAAAAPTLSLSASPASVPSGGSSTLTWSTTNAQACTASGGWSGSRATSGSASVGPLAITTAYTLTCSGAGGSVQQTSTVTVQAATGTAQLSGAVDSVYVDKTHVSAVYVFQGAVTPQDRQGNAGDPAYVVPVTQDANACSYSYALASLPAGTYTLAFTAQANLDQPNQADAIAFIGTTTVTVGASPVRHDFRPSQVLQVGAGRTYATIRAAAAVAGDGVVIEVAPGDYPDDIVVWRQNHLVVRGVGGARPHVHATAQIPYVAGSDLQNGMGLFVVKGNGVRIENIELSNASVPDQNGAGIRNQGSNLTVCNAYLHDNENGFLGGAYGTLTIEYSVLEHNGLGQTGYTHNAYVDDGSGSGDNLVFRYNYSHRVYVGHTLKTRSAQNFIAYNRLSDETDGSSSYNIDVPNGGMTYVIGNVIQQGPQTSNSTMVSYGAEGLSSGRPWALYVVNNTFVNDNGSGTFVEAAGGTTTFVATNNLFVGNGTLYSGKAPVATTNLHPANPGFVSQSTYDYHLTSGSPAIDAGSDPGSANGISLVPTMQYADPAQAQQRPVHGTLDVGAFEY